ncbi:MAG: exodeoxyribonuclease VII small subunit [Flavobacteriales bacterium]|nr:exodeoxyribonuclease VII small subunit [Flavobacteriales bacterium]
MKKKITYSEALEELEKLSDEMESGKTDPDALIEKIKRSLELVQFCRTRLRETEEQIQKLKDNTEE